MEVINSFLHFDCLVFSISLMREICKKLFETVNNLNWHFSTVNSVVVKKGSGSNSENINALSFFISK